MGAGALSDLLRQLQNTLGKHAPEELLVGMEEGDDALVWQLGEDNALIATVDFFTPIVDDPYTFGAIAAVNAMSDVFAMGGRVAFALNIAAFPPDLPRDVCSLILEGGRDKVQEAGGIIGGGHTIMDKEPKYGLCVIGFVHPARIVTRKGAQAGDLLFLTKPLGTGLITTAAKGGNADTEHLDAAVSSMEKLNNTAMAVAASSGVHAATDITGFGLIGHAREMASKSGVDFRFRFADIPLLPGTTGYASRYLFPGGTFTNLEYFSPSLHPDGDIAEEEKLILMTPETSGGLLLSIGRENADALMEKARAEGVSAALIGEAVRGEGRILVGRRSLK